MAKRGRPRQSKPLARQSGHSQQRLKAASAPPASNRRRPPPSRSKARRDQRLTPSLKPTSSRNTRSRVPTSPPLSIFRLLSSN